jgi:hypothetical protein
MTMREYLTFYIGGQWTEPDGTRTFEVVKGILGYAP